MKRVDIMGAAALVVGGLGWCLVGLPQADLVAGPFDLSSGLGRAAYSLVGLGALYQALQWEAVQRRWAYAGAGSRRL